MGEPSLEDWIGRVETRVDRVTPLVAAQLAATLPEVGHAPGDMADGAALPPLWHWLAFQPAVAMADLGTDGHPRLGGFLPPVALERRMWAGGRLVFHHPLRIGERLERRSEILKLSEKEGSTGRMVFVTVGHQLGSAEGLAIEEEQDIVYIAMPDAYRPPKAVPAPAGSAFDEPVAVGTPRLFCYSAATFNAHRIHYDLPYAREVEKYPGLVVHGPMQAMLLMGAVIRHAGRAPGAFRFRGVYPMFDTHDLRLMGVADGPAMELCTVAEPGGQQGLQARAEWETA